MTTKPTQRNEIHGFSKGLLTELNPLNSQIDTTISESNFELKRDGTRTRRLGMDLESGFTPVALDLDEPTVNSSQITSFMWKGVSGDPGTKFFVVRIANKLKFFKLNSDNGSELVSSVDISVTPEASVAFTSVQGFLVIAAGAADMFLVTYDLISKTFSVSTFRISIRDFFGIEETIEKRYETDNTYRGKLNWQHYYNLYNQGWGIPRLTWWTGTISDAVSLGSDYLHETQSPSNQDKVWSGLTQRPRSNPDFYTFEAFNFVQFQAITGVEGFVSKGYFIIDAFNRGASRQTQWVAHKNKYPVTGGLISSFNPPADITSNGPTSIATHAGRVFYSGINGAVTNGDKRSPNYNNFVFFSQLIKNQQDFGKCYQEGDPTSRESFDLVDTDGGYIVIPEAINIHTMYSLGDQLFLIAENGVWSVAGGSGYGFTASNYLVTKLSSFGGYPGNSFVELGGVGFFWGSDGIYTISKNQYGDYEVSNQTKTTIDSFFQNISSTAHTNVQGFADKYRNQVRWLYRDDNLFTDSQVKELVLDLNFKAFIPNTIHNTVSNSCCVITGTHGGDYSSDIIEDSIVAGLDEVVVGVDDVILDITVKKTLATTAKYIGVQKVGSNIYIFTCEYNNTDFVDWGFTGEGSDAEAFMVTNTFTGGDFAVKKQIPYLTMAFAETEKTYISGVINQESSCIGRFMWDFTHRERSKKWTREIQLYRKSKWYYDDFDIDNGFSLNIVKSKVRGIGKSFALHVKTEPLKACHIYGWNLTLTGNTST